MRIFKDAFNGDEMFSDSRLVTTIQDIMYEIEGKFIIEREGDYGIGSNADEDAETSTGESVEKSEKRVIDIVSSHRLEQTGFDKKSFMAYIRGYMKRVKTHLEEKNPPRVAAFQAAAQNIVKQIIANFDDYTFYTGSSMDVDAGVALMFYREDGITPAFWFFKDGLIEEKV